MRLPANRLGWPVGTIRGRLSRARDLLRSRLTRRGVTASAALTAVGSLSETARAAVPAALGDRVVRAAAEIATGRTIAAVASAQVAAWVEGASRSLAVYRGLSAAGFLIFLGAIGTGLALLVASPSSEFPQAERPASPDPREATRREMLQLKGTWSTMTTVESTINGVPQKPKQVKMIWSIDRDLIKDTDEDGFAGKSYRFTLDPQKVPKHIDLAVLNSGLKLYGIYKLEGNALTVSLGGIRPDDFEEGPPQFRLLCRFRRESRTPAQLGQEYPNAPGCFWAIEPKGSVPSSVHSGGVNVITRKDARGALVVTLAYITKSRDDENAQQYRPVAFDDKRVRHLLAGGAGGSSGSSTIAGATLVLGEHRLDPEVLPYDRVKHVGIELVPPEALQAARVAASMKAAQAAREAGVEILPAPEIGKPFEFSLTDTKGRLTRSAELKGKVVLIDCWAGWCSPCMAKMPGLKKLYERRHAEGFDVIGINFDHKRERAEELIKSVGLPWAEVYVPDDDRTRGLWADGPGIGGLPRLFLIDRQGILRWEGGPGEVEARVNGLLE